MSHSDTTLDAERLAALIQKDIFDAEDAAKFLGIERNSLEYAAYRGRLSHVQYGAKKWFTRHDLLDYRAKRGRGRESMLEEAPRFIVK